MVYAEKDNLKMVENKDCCNWDTEMTCAAKSLIPFYFQIYERDTRK